jgi:hypothetical protein
MIDSVTPISIISSYIRTNINGFELHKFISINDNFPKHEVQYVLYNSRAGIEEYNKPQIDIFV